MTDSVRNGSWKTDRARLLDSPEFGTSLKGLLSTGVAGTSRSFDSTSVASDIKEMVFAEIQDSTGIHVETVLTALGATAGFAGQMAIREHFIRIAPIKLSEALVEVKTADGGTFYFGDYINEPLVTTNKGQHSVWGFVAGAAQHLGATALPDLTELFTRTARTVGSSDFAVPRLPPQNMPKLPAIELLNKFWNPIRNYLVPNCTNPGVWPFVLGHAAQITMIQAKGIIDPSVAAQILMEAAVPMSRIDPRCIHNAELMTGS